MKFIKKIFFIKIYLTFFNYKKDLSFNDLNFKKIDFTNYKQIKTKLIFPGQKIIHQKD